MFNWLLKLIKKCNAPTLELDLSCPKCKKKMSWARNYYDWSLSTGRSPTNYLICFNKKCKYYGLLRVLTEDRVKEVKNE